MAYFKGLLLDQFICFQYVYLCCALVFLAVIVFFVFCLCVLQAVLCSLLKLYMYIFFSILSFATAIIVLYIVSPHEEEIVVEEWWNKASDFNRLLNINVVFI